MKQAATLFFLAFLCLPAWSQVTDGNQNWPQWRGPEATGVAPLGDPPVEWSEEKNVRWKTEIPGLGHSSPIVWGDKVFVLSAIETDKSADAQGGQEEQVQSTGRRRRGGMSGKTSTKIHEFALFALDRRSGDILWKRVACEATPHEGTHNDGSWASNSPVTDGERVYAYFGSRGLYCFDMEGEPLWNKDFGDMAKRMAFGEGSSPVLCGDMIVVNWDHEGDSFIIALDKKTGDERWKIPREEGTSWATPIVVELDGKRQIITCASNLVRSYDPSNGKVIWECSGLTANVIPSPVYRDGMLYVMSGYRGNALLAIRLAGAAGDISNSEAIVWQYNQDTPYAPSPLLYKNHLYFFRSNSGALTCLDAKTGQAHYARQQLEGVTGVYPAPVGAKDRVYLVGRNGLMKVIKLGPEYEVLAANVLKDEFTASPAIVDKELFLRGHKYLYCIAQN